MTTSFTRRNRPIARSDKQLPKAFRMHQFRYRNAGFKGNARWLAKQSAKFARYS